MSVSIRIENAKKSYGPVDVIKDLSVNVENGELFTLLGPSGCGKTTLLRMIAGFNTIEGGDFYFNDLRINDVDPAKRNIGMVFQNYAIFPNLTVRKNVEFGLKYRDVPKDEIRLRAEEFLDLVQVSEHADKMPEKLSGGQQQRVALARALVIQPAVLLMDEPLSNLDAKLRVEMRTAIRHIQKDVGITTVYVTHDQEEAMAISDRIAVMNFGEILQCASPQEIYQRPINLFVATFIGQSNLINAVVADGNEKRITLDNGSSLIIPDLVATTGQELTLSVRPEEFKIHDGKFTGKEVRGTITDSIFLGLNTHYTVKLDTGDEVLMIQESGLGFVHKEGDEVILSINTEKVNVFDRKSTESLMRSHIERRE